MSKQPHSRHEACPKSSRARQSKGTRRGFFTNVSAGRIFQAELLRRTPFAGQIFPEHVGNLTNVAVQLEKDWIRRDGRVVSTSSRLAGSDNGIEVLGHTAFDNVGGIVPFWTDGKLHKVGGGVTRGRIKVPPEATLACLASTPIDTKDRTILRKFYNLSLDKTSLAGRFQYEVMHAGVESREGRIGFGQRCQVVRKGKDHVFD